MTMECLFVAPDISSHALFQKWKEIKEDCHLQGMGIESVGITRETLIEAIEMVREGESSFGVRISRGIWGNEIVMDWNGTPLVRVHALRNGN
ncbi:hypothetical protein SLA2020_385350 [Shorea laevis]